MKTAEWFVPDEAFQSFHAECELSRGEGALGAEAAGPEALKVLGSGVFRAVDDMEVFPAAACHGGLNEASLAFCEKVQGFPDHPFAATASEFVPPSREAIRASLISGIHYRFGDCSEPPVRNRAQEHLTVSNSLTGYF